MTALLQPFQLISVSIPIICHCRLLNDLVFSNLFPPKTNPILLPPLSLKNMHSVIIFPIPKDLENLPSSCSSFPSYSIMSFVQCILAKSQNFKLNFKMVPFEWYFCPYSASLEFLGHSSRRSSNVSPFLITSLD